MHVYGPMGHDACGGQRTTVLSCFFFSTMWVPGIKLSSPSLVPVPLPAESSQSPPYFLLSHTFPVALTYPQRPLCSGPLHLSKYIPFAFMECVFHCPHLYTFLISLLSSLLPVSESSFYVHLSLSHTHIYKNLNLWSAHTVFIFWVLFCLTYVFYKIEWEESLWNSFSNACITLILNSDENTWSRNIIDHFSWWT